MGADTNYRALRQELDELAVSCGREPSDIVLISVSKTVDVPAVEQAVLGGAHDFGENRPEELVKKSSALPGENWHFIGNIQSRRIADIVPHAVLIHSLFKESHIAKIDAAARACGKVQDVLVEVNVSGEESKGGVTPAEVPAFVARCNACANVRVCGLMTMAPAGDLDAAKATFEGLARLFTEVKGTLSATEAAVFSELSMGMSEDWHLAVPAGATMVRIGRAVFSDTFNMEQ